jgi:hypothetical protein
MRVPLLLGRTFRPGDLTGAAPVILSQSLARALFGDADPIGRRIRVGSSKWDEPVIGVVGDLPGASVADGPMRTIYFPLLDDMRATPSVRPSTPLYPAEVSLFVRTNDEDAAALIPAIRRIVREIDPHVPVSRPRMLSDVVAASVARSRLTTILLLLGACATLLLGVVGVYGVTSYVVAARTREMSIQMALGATSSGVRMRVVRQHIGSTSAGVVVGIGVALALTRLLRGLLYQVSPADPMTLAAAALGIVLVAVLASWLPSRRVARLDIVNALRGE